MDQARRGCAYCFSTLNPHDQRDGYSTFMVCLHCDALYHTACWQRHPACVKPGCLSGHVEPFDVPAPAPLTVLQRARTTLPQPTTTVYQFGHMILSQGQMLLYLSLALGALLLLGIMSSGLVSGITTEAEITTTAEPLSKTTNTVDPVALVTLNSTLTKLSSPAIAETALPIAIIPSATLPTVLPIGTTASENRSNSTSSQLDQRSTAVSAPQPTIGVQVIAVEPGSPADVAGFRMGQILISLNNQPVHNVEEVRAIVAQNAGRPVDAVVWADGVQETLTVIPESGPIGIDLCRLGRCLLDQPGVSSTGMRIVAIDPGSPADRAGFRAGQILISLNNQPVHNVEEIRAIVQASNGLPIVAHVVDGEAELAISFIPRNGLLGVDLCELSRCP